MQRKICQAQAFGRSSGYFSVSQSGRNRPLEGDFDGQGNEKIKGGERGAKPLIDNCVNFSILLLRLATSLQILIYYDNRWRLLLKQFICWIFGLDRLCARLQFGLFQGCGVVVKMSQLRLRSSSFVNMAPAPELLVFMSVATAPELSFFMAQAQARAPTSVRFNTLIY